MPQRVLQRPAFDISGTLFSSRPLLRSVGIFGARPAVGGIDLPDLEFHCQQAAESQRPEGEPILRHP
jgi:hypothetical protein